MVPISFYFLLPMLRYLTEPSDFGTVRPHRIVGAIFLNMVQTTTVFATGNTAALRWHMIVLPPAITLKGRLSSARESRCLSIDVQSLLTGKSPLRLQIKGDELRFPSN